MSIAKQIAQGMGPLVDLVYPPRCPVCGDQIGQQGGLCLTCWSELAIPGQPACVACSRPLGEDVASGEAICAPCLQKPPIHSGIAAGTLYNDISRKLTLAFKHGGKIGLAPLMAKLMAAKLPMEEGDAPVLVPVPLHRWRLWKRGYNQAAFLAKELEKLAKGKSVPDALLRIRPTQSLGGMGRTAREKELSGAIRINSRRSSYIEGADVILVDDVLTSGATADRCVEVLLKAGARSVKIACFARVLEEALPLAGKKRGQKSETPEVQRTPGAT